MEILKTEFLANRFCEPFVKRSFVLEKSFWIVTNRVSNFCGFLWLDPVEHEQTAVIQVLTLTSKNYLGESKGSNEERREERETDSHFNNG